MGRKYPSNRAIVKRAKTTIRLITEIRGKTSLEPNNSWAADKIMWNIFS